MRSFVPAAACALLLLLTFPPAAADNDSLKVLVLVEDKEYSIGTNVTVTVLVYDGGVPTAPDTAPDVTILSAAPRVFQVFSYGNGLFKGNFTIQASDVVGNLVPVEASATLGKSEEGDKTYNKDTDLASIYLSTPQAGALTVRLYAKSVSDNVIRPGAGVTVAAEVTGSGSPVQPDSLDIVASYQDPEGGSFSEPLNASSTGTGLFEATYALPQVTYDLRLTLTATARAGNSTETASLSLDFNQLWVVYHNSTKSATGTTFYLHVADPSGQAQSGATFDFSYWPDGNLSQSKKGSVAPADDYGKSRFSLDFESGARTLTLEGRVNASGRSQRFTGIIDVSAPTSTPIPSTGAFEMVYAGPGDLYAPGKEAEREYVAFNNSVPLQNAEIFTYIVASPFSTKSPVSFTPVELVKARPFTTDARGRVTIPFKPPAYDSYVIFYFKNATAVHPKPSGYFFNHDSNDGQYYSETADVVVVNQRFSGSSVQVQASPYTAGKPAPVKATASGAGSGSAYAMWIPGDFDPAFPQGAPSERWQVWVGLGSYLNRTAGGFSGSVTLPVFMPAKVKYTVVVFVTDSGSTFPLYGSATLTNADKEAQTDSFWMQYLYLFIIAVAVIGCAAAAITIRRRRARAAAPSGVSRTIACPACGTSFAVLQLARPVQIKCPNCGKSGTLPPLAAAAAQPAAAPGAASPATAPPVPAAPSVVSPAAAPPPLAGAKLSITCPSCGTPFDIVRGPGPTRIQCPNCGKSGMIGGLGEPAAAPPAPAPAPVSGETAMQAQMAAAAPPTATSGRLGLERPEGRLVPDDRSAVIMGTDGLAQSYGSSAPTLMQAQAAMDMPRPEPVVETRTIACPQCRNRFTIEKKEGPQQIRCPHCGKEGTIGKAAAPAPAPAAAPVPAPAPATRPYQPPAQQPMALARQPATAPPTPAGPYGQTRAQPAAQAPAAPAGRLITCPACRHRFPVSDPRRPIRIRCPACGKEGTLAR